MQPAEVEEQPESPVPALTPCLSFRESPISAVESPQKISAVESATSDDHGTADDDGDEEFEFAFVLGDPDSCPSIGADEIFSNGRIRPVYPVFNRDLLLLSDGDGSPASSVAATVEPEKAVVRLPLGRFLIEERGAEAPLRSGSLSSSSSEPDELEGIPPDSYCTWAPRGRRKSSSTGSSLRWRLRDLVVGRSHSDGKEKFVFLAADEKDKAKAAAAEDYKTPSGGGRRSEDKDTVTAHRTTTYYGKSGSGRANGGRKSFLPYKPDLVGFFSTVNGISRTHQPF